MEESKFLSIFLIMFGAVPCFVTWYFMSIKQKRELIASWKDEWFNNPKKAATVLGYFMFLAAVIILISSLGLWFELLNQEHLKASFILVGFVFVSGFVLLKTRFAKRSS